MLPKLLMSWPWLVSGRINPWRWRLRRRSLAFLLGMGMMLGVAIAPAIAQSPSPVLPLDALSEPLPDWLDPSRRPTTVSPQVAWVQLDGRSLFQIATEDNTVATRAQEIERNLRSAARDFLTSDRDAPEIAIATNNGLPVVNVDQHYILTVTHLDAHLHQTTPADYAATLRDTIGDALQSARQERQPQALLRQTQQAIALGAGVILLSLVLRYVGNHWQRSATARRPSTAPTASDPAATQLTEQRDRNWRALQKLLVQMGQVVIWGGGLFWMARLFPQTRGVPVWISQSTAIYLQSAGILLGTYVVLRLSFIAIDRTIAAVLLSTRIAQGRPESIQQRLQQRVHTVSSVAKSVTAIVVCTVGALLSLLQLGIDVGPLVAGAGLIGVALSLASQNLIRDAINGFLILVEDQYAVGDVIQVGEVLGKVETMTLRITQLRDPEERLITIPNSEVRVVSNLSSHHSQADLKIPVAYNSDIDQALHWVRQVCWELAVDPHWSSVILSTPLILGVDEFTHTGVVIRVWIRTLPLKQWDVAREYRRRIKVAFDRAGIELVRSRHTVWLDSDASLGLAELGDRPTSDHGAIANPEVPTSG
jgi:small conductance mechanosensitive channel